MRVVIEPQPAETASDVATHPPKTSLTPLEVRPGSLDRRIAVRVAIQAGLLGLLISIIPFLGIVLTGALAVFLYRRAGGYALSAGAASRLGAAAGTVSFAISSFFMLVRMVVFHAQQEYQDVMMKVAQAIGMDPKGPEVQDMIRAMMSPPGLALTLFFSFIIGVALAAIGGALAASMARPTIKS